MNKYAAQQMAIMVLGGVILSAVLLISTNVIANRFIDKAAYEALNSAVEDFREPALNNGADLLLDEASTNFIISLIYPQELQNERELSFRFLPSEHFIYETWKAGELPENRMTRLEGPGALYYAVAIKMPYSLQHETGLENEPLEAILYTNVTSVQNMVRDINLKLLPIMLVGIVLMGLVGVHFGRRLEDSQEKLSRFFQNASHELKTPLQSIQGYAEGLLLGVLKDEKEVSRVILRQSEKMGSLIDEILIISRLESGAYRIKKEPLQLTELLYDSLYLHEPLAKERGLSILPEIPEDLPEILGDEIQFPKVFNAVLSNALRYAEKEIRIQAKSTKKHVYVTIEDDGPGIDSEVMSKIFDRFYSGDATGSSGIGLAMAKEILSYSGGSIKAWNGARGAIFQIVLPR